MVFARYVRRSDDGKILPGNSLTEVNSLDTPAGNRTTHRGPVDHPLEMKIVHIPGLTGDFVSTLLARHRQPNQRMRHQRSLQKIMFQAYTLPCGGTNPFLFRRVLEGLMFRT